MLLYFLSLISCTAERENDDCSMKIECSGGNCTEKQVCVDLSSQTGPINSTRDPNALDYTIDYGKSESDIQIHTPVYTIGPYTDKENCFFYRYMGEDTYFTGGIAYQEENFGHHVVIMVGSPGEDYDLTAVGSDCNAAMDYIWYDIVEPNQVLGPGITSAIYPEGLGYRLTKGTEIMVQSHHVNYSGNTILVNDRFDLIFSPEEEIEHMAAPLEVGDDDVEIPVGFYEYVHECIVEEEFYIAWLTGHMHENGLYTYIDLVKDGQTTRLYEVNDWLDEYYITSPVEYFLPDGILVEPGDTLLLTCAWQNDTGSTISFPKEMCYGGGIIFPSILGYQCDPFLPN